MPAKPRPRKPCIKCGRLITNSNYDRHLRACGGRDKTLRKIKAEWKQSNGKYKCPHCDKEFTKAGIGGHIWRMHTEEGKSFDPSFGYRKGTRSAWNKGLTEHIDTRVKRNAITIREGYENGTIKRRKGFKHSKETKKKISDWQLKFLEKNPDQVLYRKFHSSKESYPEKRFRKSLEKAGIQGWIYRYPAGIYEYDFAFPELKLDVEIDGSTHLKPEVKKKDIRRDAWSRSQGWSVARFTAREIKTNLQDVIIKLEKKIEELKNSSVV